MTRLDAYDMTGAEVDLENIRRYGPMGPMEGAILWPATTQVWATSRAPSQGISQYAY